MITKTTFVLITLMALTSCGERAKDRSTISQEEMSDRPLEVTQREAVDFVRQKQMTSRYNCDGLLETRELEDLNGLSKKVVINFEYRRIAERFIVLNRRTRDSRKGLVAKNGEFRIDYSPTVFNMRVKDGINDIEYVFERCVEFDKGGNKCLKTEVAKEGIVQLDVSYRTEILPGERHIKASDVSCEVEKKANEKSDNGL